MNFVFRLDEDRIRILQQTPLRALHLLSVSSSASAESTEKMISCHV